ncbi:hypothetical protein [Sphaerochaeta sp.]|uniref:hypothetical protein n=1 Tax=Sphaerochaeta sp. TaxID=1972642 RepID=UPI003D0EABCB
MRTNVIKSILPKDKGIGALSVVLCGFKPDAILEKFKSYDAVQDAIQNEFDKDNRIRCETKSIWPGFCKTILDAVHFLKQFKDGQEFIA